MKISTLTLDNFKGIKHLEIKPFSHNVTISGRNGTGKTTIADAIVWTLSGKLSDGSIGNIKPIGTDFKTSEVAIVLDDGTQITRELSEKTIRGQFAGKSTSIYIDGVPTKPTAFKRKMQELTRDKLEVLISPIDFLSSGRWKERRDLLIELFDGEIETSPEVAKILGKLNPDDFISAVNVKIKKLDKMIEPLRGQIKEVTNQLKEIELEGDYEGLQDKLKAAEAENAQLSNAGREVSVLHRRLDSQADYRDKLTSRLESLERETNPICPTCGASLSEAKFAEIKSGKISDVTEKIKSVDAEMEKINAKIEELELQIGKLSKVDTHELDEKIRAHKQYRQLENRREQLLKEERDHNADKSKLEGDRDKVRSFIAAKADALESAINANFETVEFRMRELVASTGEYKDCCEVFVGGVPFNDGLNKGAKLKAALEVMRVLQAKFGVELPLIIDDAESYTQNSFVDVPNQLWLFKVVDDDFKVTVWR